MPRDLWSRVFRHRCGVFVFYSPVFITPPFLPWEFIQLLFKHFKHMQYPVARISQFRCAVCEEMDNLCQRRCLCIITLDVIFRSQGSPMLSDIKGVRAVLGYSSSFIPAFMPEPGCLTMDQSPVMLSTVQTQKVSPVAEQHTSMSTGLHRHCSKGCTKELCSEGGKWGNHLPKVTQQSQE